MKKAFAEEKEDIDETNFDRVIREGLNARKLEKCEELIRGHVAISYDDFLKNGRNWLKPSIFDALSAEVIGMRIGCHFVVAGFSRDKYPMICETDDFCRVVSKDDFAIVGEGRSLARASLLQRRYTTVNEWPEAAYKVYEAKKVAENNATVGDYTSIEILRADGFPRSIKDDGKQALDIAVSKYGPKLVHGNVADLTTDHWWGEP